MRVVEVSSPSATSGLRRVLSDAFAMVVFSFAVGLAVETLISGLTLSQSLHARFSAVPVNFITARPYGWFRDKVLWSAQAESGGLLRKTAAEVVAFGAFQIPIYFVILLFSGASAAQIATSCATLAALSAFMGRPYGVFLDFSRRLFSVST